MFYKGFTVRFYPYHNQIELLQKHFGACRYIWNYMLDLQVSRYKSKEKHLTAFDMINLLPQLKKDGVHNWLSEVSSTSLSITCRDLENAYQSMFKKKAKYPKHKSKKRSKPKFPVGSAGFYFCDDKQLVMPKIGKVRYKSDIKFKAGRLACKFYNVRVFTDNNKWFVSFSIECDNQAPELTDEVMGIDLGVKELATVVIGDKKFVYHNINKSKQMRDLVNKRKRIEHNLSRKYTMNKSGNKYNKTNNIIKEEDKLRKVYHRINGIRDNYIHQTTHSLVSMLPKRVVMEDLNIIGMIKSKKFSGRVQEQKLFEFRRQMEYKCGMNSIEFVLADKNYPSSKTCSCCGNVKKDLKLSDRVYVCSNCGAVVDRDFNAAVNLSRYVA